MRNISSNTQIELLLQKFYGLMQDLSPDRIKRKDKNGPSIQGKIPGKFELSEHSLSYYLHHFTPHILCCYTASLCQTETW